MAKQKKETDVTEVAEVAEVAEAAAPAAPTFTKKQFVKSRTFGRYKDYLTANLEDGETYTKAQVVAMIEKTYKVKLNIK